MAHTHHPSLALGVGISLGILAMASCTDDTGPNRPAEARFAVAPVFASSAAGALDITAIRFEVTRASDGSLAADTVLQIQPGQDSVNLELSVLVLDADETFFLTIAMVDVAGDTIFRGGPTEVTPTTTGGTPPIVPVEIVYVGIGFNAYQLERA